MKQGKTQDYAAMNGRWMERVEKIGCYIETRHERRKKANTRVSLTPQFLFCFNFYFVYFFCSRFFINGCSLNTYMCVALLKIAFMFDVDGLNSCAILIRRCRPGWGVAVWIVMSCGCWR